MKKRSRKFWIICSLALFLSVMVGLMYTEDSIDITEKEQIDFRQKVSAWPVKVQEHSGVIKTFAAVKPRWSAVLKAHVDGEVIEVSNQAMAGERVNKGDLLVRIEDSAYQAELAQARKNLAEANLELIKQRSQSEQARRDWQRTGLKTKPSAMALNKPQLEIAEKTVELAKASIAAAEKRRIYTTVTAPFSGVVTERFVSLGQTVNIGDQLLSVLNQSKLDITASVSLRQWQNLAEDWALKKVKVNNGDNEQIALATIKRGGGFLDQQSRQYKLFLEIDNDQSNRVLAGEFVNIEIPGRSVANTLLVPASVYTREGKVWYVDQQSRLRFFDSQIVFYQGDDLIITAPEDFAGSEIKVILAPLASFVAGKEVLATISESL